MPETEVLARFSELKVDVKDALGRIERTIDKLSDTIRTDYVTRHEFDGFKETVKRDIDEIKTSSRWRVSGVLFPAASTLLAITAIAVNILGR